VVDQPSAHTLIAYLQLRRNFRTHKKTLDPGLRRDDDFEAKSSSNVIPAQGGAGFSGRMRPARETIMAYSP
jgi:hypothetical protein